jgi:Flp pilus assembly protein CpaB
MARTVRTNRRQSSPLAVGFVALLLAIVLTVAAVAGLWALGLVELSFLFPRVALESHEGMVGIPVANQPIPAFALINRDFLADPKTGGLNFMWLKPETVEKVPGMITDPTKIVGRVVRHEKMPGYPFTESDFLPEGTRPGLTGGTPAGKRALTLSIEQVNGAFGLRTGDHIDLMATAPIDATSINQGTDAQTKGLAAQARIAKLRKRASVRVLAQDAVVVTPVTARSKPITSSTLMGGTQTRTIPVQEIVIAVNPEEAAAISEALAMHLEIDCVIRSGRPDDPGPAVETPGADPLADTSIIVLDTILGSKRDTQVFSNSGARVTPPAKDSTGGTGADLPPPPPPASRDGLGAGVEPRGGSGRGVSTAGLP